MTRLVLVRHGQAVCNVERTIEGVGTCRGLSTLGRSQAEALARRFVDECFAPDAVVVSPIRRARETADIVTAQIGGTPVLDADFEEVRPGEAEGMTWDQYGAAFGWQEGWDPSVPFAPGAEPWTDFARRVGSALDRLSVDHCGKTVLVVAHGGVVDASLFHYFGFDPQVQSPIDFETTNTSITEWTQRSVPTPGDDQVHRWTLHRYNDAAHLSNVKATP